MFISVQFHKLHVVLIAVRLCRSFLCMTIGLDLFVNSLNSCAIELHEFSLNVYTKLCGMMPAFVSC